MIWLGVGSLGGRAFCPPTRRQARGSADMHVQDRALRRVGGQNALPPKDRLCGGGPKPRSLRVSDSAPSAGWELQRPSRWQGALPVPCASSTRRPRRGGKLAWNKFRNPLIARPLFFVGDGLVPSRRALWARWQFACANCWGTSRWIRQGRDKPVPYELSMFLARQRFGVLGGVETPKARLDRATTGQWREGILLTRTKGAPP